MRTLRPHNKSRQGCLNCKARRVKCQETRPSPCYNCSSRQLECIYPSKDQLVRRRHATHGISYRRGEEREHDFLVSTPINGHYLPSSQMELGSPSYMLPEAFTGHDLRFLHHFLITAYPHLPFGSEDLWKTSLPAYAHECPHLMHAILSLGASHLSLISPRADEYTPLALAHRGKALKYLGDMLATVDQYTKTDLDLILATTYALTFQANYMTDGLVDFAVMVRGCTTVTRRIRSQGQESDMFRLLMSEAIYARVCSQLPLTPCWDADMLEMSIEAIEGIQPLLETNGHRINYHAILNTYRCMRISGQQGFIALSEVYNGWGSMDYQEFMNFLDSGNHISRLLLLHYVTVTIMMKTVFSIFRPSMRENPKDTLANHQWGIGIYRSLPAKFRGLVELQYRFIVTDKAWIEEGGTISASVNAADVFATITQEM